MAESPLLLLIKGFGQDSGAQIPGKLYEYLGSGNKILYLWPADVEAADIIRENDAGYIVEDNADELARVILHEFKAWLEKNEKEISLTRNKTMTTFSAKTMADSFDRIIQKNRRHL